MINNLSVKHQSNHAANHTSIANSASVIITVFEHQRLRAADFAQPADFTWLLTQELAVFSIKRQQGQWQLKVGHYIGIIILPSGATLEILPKPIAGMSNKNTAQIDEIIQARQWVQRMLTDLTSGFADNNKLPNSKNLGQLSQQLAPLSIPAAPLSQWLAGQFLQLLAAYQPSKRYRTQTCNQATLQGKLLIKEQLRRHSAQPHKFACAVNTLSPDTLSNRLIKSALLLIESLLTSLLELPLAKLGSAQVTLATSISAWRHISALDHHQWRNLQLIYVSAKQQLRAQPMAQQRQQAAQQLLELSYWLLQAQQANIHAGSSLHQQNTGGATAQLRLCLLINMNQAFEQWASVMIANQFKQLQAEQPLPAQPSPQQHKYHAVHQPRDVWLRDAAGQVCLSVQPDLLIYRVSERRQCSHVIDLKWKHLAQATAISAGDAYQLTSYAQAYQAEQVWLVYPVTDSSRQAVRLYQPTTISNANHKPNYGSTDNPSYDASSSSSAHAQLWLMPFNVLTGRLNV